MRNPTRQDYLLDLVCTDIERCTATLMPYIAGHRRIRLKMPMSGIFGKTISQEVWISSEANWSSLREDLENFDWRRLNEGSAEDALTFLFEI